MVESRPLPEDQWGPERHGSRAFKASTNPGNAAGPIAESRIGRRACAFHAGIQSRAGRHDPVPVLVFDEVDSGIGGAVASAVGERLARLAEHVQILVVTHSPQVAARGANHLRVSNR